MAISEVQSPREGAKTTLTEHPLMLSVNGEQLHAQVMADTPLLLVLRNDLALNGPKYGCGLGALGVSGRAIVTLEGLGDRQRPHPVQRAFIEEQAAQCGYCLNGMIMTTKALLDRNPAPSEAEIRQALSGNLCRCGTKGKRRC
ncbi:(2Fe-2S)-binding protein [Serratia marcescens]|uniref:(2Fe-2S)-binding protein n=1 Tax=Serratia marcescens TaxID=615 RepID=UPI000EF24B60|nr:2Fe-2S iron-sulfur cluster-binding protein [Serratia marcescens]RLO52721.1 ferredoxin [Serratia marcescens]